jgi:hypothetical protein
MANTTNAYPVYAGSYQNNDYFVKELIEKTRELAPEVNSDEADVSIQKGKCSYGFTEEVDYHDPDKRDFTLTFDEGNCCSEPKGEIRYATPNEAGEIGHTVKGPKGCCSTDYRYETIYADEQTLNANADDVNLVANLDENLAVQTRMLEAHSGVENNIASDVNGGNGKDNSDVIPSDGNNECCNLSPEATAGLVVGGVAAGVMTCLALKKAYGKPNSYNIKSEKSMPQSKNSSGVIESKPLNLAKFSNKKGTTKSKSVETKSKQLSKLLTSKSKKTNKPPVKLI